jgi:hypothetical protein
MGSGSQRLYSVDDMLLGMAIRSLLLAGFDLRLIRLGLIQQVRDAIGAGRSEYQWGTGPVEHSLNLAQLREHLHGLVAA